MPDSCRNTIPALRPSHSEYDRLRFPPLLILSLGKLGEWGGEHPLKPSLFGKLTNEWPEGGGGGRWGGGEVRSHHCSLVGTFSLWDGCLLVEGPGAALSSVRLAFCQVQHTNRASQPSSVKKSPKETQMEAAGRQQTVSYLSSSILILLSLGKVWLTNQFPLLNKRHQTRSLRLSMIRCSANLLWTKTLLNKSCV